MTGLIYKNLAPTLQDMKAFCLPYLSSLQGSIGKISNIIEEKRTLFSDAFVKNRVVIIAGVSIGISLYWIYLFIFGSKEELQAKRREQIPFASPPDLGENTDPSKKTT